jgi:hypothetical protein
VREMHKIGPTNQVYECNSSTLPPLLTPKKRVAIREPQASVTSQTALAAESDESNFEAFYSYGAGAVIQLAYLHTSRIYYSCSQVQHHIV